MEIVPPDEPQNVVQFRRLGLEDEYRRSTYVDARGKCQHTGTKIVDEKHRTIECESCKALLDPVACLLEIATEWRMYHGPRLKALREYMAAKRQAGEDFAAWWQRVGRGRSYPTKKRAAEEAWLMASAPELKLCEKLYGDAENLP